MSGAYLQKTLRHLEQNGKVVPFCVWLAPYNVPSRPYASISSEAAAADFTDEAHSADSTLEPPENPTQETVEELLRKKNEVAKGDLQATTNTKPVLGIGGFTSSIKIN
ncbi:hypothetical protein ACFX13_028295 [Malus domestica]